MINIPCITAAILIVVGNILRITQHFKQGTGFDYEKWKDLDPTFLESEWQIRRDNRKIYSASEFLTALGWFAACIPIMQVAWILSKGGRRRIGTHLLICALAVAGSISELLSRLMMVGVNNAADYMSADFNLDNWLGSNSGDKIGWRTLEVAHFIAFAIVIWVDAFMWLTLSGVLIMIFISVRSDKDTSPSFGKLWSILGLVVGVLAFIDFLAYIARYGEWRVFSTIAIFLSMINTLLLLPAWLIVLGLQLTKASQRFEVTAMPGEEIMFVGNGESFKEEEKEKEKEKEGGTLS